MISRTLTVEHVSNCKLLCALYYRGFNFLVFLLLCVRFLIEGGGKGSGFGFELRFLLSLHMST